MGSIRDAKRYLAGEPPDYLRRPLARLQPVLAKRGKPNIDSGKLASVIEGVGVLEEMIPIVELCFDGKTLLLGDGEVCEATRHRDMPHCESTALLRFRDLEGFVENISREHTVVVYGEHIEELTVLGETLGLNCKVF